ncbi:MAG: DUF2325 domain-containing protein [Janthinobacterium lividum]
MSASIHPAVLLKRRDPFRPTYVLPSPAVSFPLPSVKRQRAKIWELNESIHCSIIGTCLTTGELRRVMAKVVREGVAGLSDHDLHSQAVGSCNQHSQAAKLVHKALDQRHELVIKRFARIVGEAAVLEAWSEHRKSGDIPGAYWAVLTHPDVSADGMRRAFGHVHMLSHLIGAANRADIRRLTALEGENAGLQAKVERQQARLQQEIATRDDTIRRLGTLAARRIEADLPAASEDALAGLRHLVTDLQCRLDRETARRERLELRTAEAVEAAQVSQIQARAAEVRANAAERELVALEGQECPGHDVVELAPRRVLYVGGRPSAIQRMREVLNDAGGLLLTHDGGRHDHSSLLPGLIGQADIVVFPVDCVSHDAALTIKRLCRQQSRPWAPLRTSGLGSFLAALSEPSPIEEVCS